jgi:hypothetical protein
MIQIISSNFDKTLSSSRMKTSFLLSPKESYRLQVNYIQASFRSNLWLYKLNVLVQQLDQTPAKHTGTYYACPRIAGQHLNIRNTPRICKLRSPCFTTMSALANKIDEGLGPSGINRKTIAQTLCKPVHGIMASKALSHAKNFQFPYFSGKIGQCPYPGTR